MIRAIVILLVCAASLVLSDQGFAAPEERFGDQPIRIRSESLEAEQGLRMVSFLGKVEARQGDLVIYCEELKIFYGESGERFDRVEALRDVRVVQGARMATGDKGIYYAGEERIVLTGNPKIRQGESFIEGEEVTILLNEERSLVRSKDGSRVNAVFVPRKEGP